MTLVMKELSLRPQISSYEGATEETRNGGGIILVRTDKCDEQRNVTE